MRAAFQAAALLGGIVAATGWSQQVRLRPPEALGCPRDKLTSFTGRVLFYSRDATRMVLRMRTDEETTERFVVRYAKDQDAARWLLLWGKPFQAEDWRTVEAGRGRLHPGMRATVWVCEGGSNPVVDWRPARAGR